MFIPETTLKFKVDTAKTEELVARYESCFSIFLNEFSHMSKFPDANGRKVAQKERLRMRLNQFETIEACLTIQSNFANESEEYIIDCIERLSYTDAVEQFLKHTGLTQKSKNIFNDELLDNDELIRKMIMKKDQNQNKLDELIISNYMKMNSKGISLIHREHSNGLEAYIF